MVSFVDSGFYANTVHHGIAAAFNKVKAHAVKDNISKIIAQRVTPELVILLHVLYSRTLTDTQTVKSNVGRIAKRKSGLLHEL